MAMALVATRTAHGANKRSPQRARPALASVPAQEWAVGAPAGARELLPLLDLAGVALALVDPAGRLVASTAAFDYLLASGTGRRLLWNTARRLVDALQAVPVHVRLSRSTAMTAEREVTTSDGRCYRVAVAIPHPASGAEPGEDGWAAVTLRLATALTDQSPPLERALTGREREVVDLLADGHTTRATAAALGISPHTARHHAERAYEKLGVRSRALLGVRLAQLAAQEAAAGPARKVTARAARARTRR